MRASPESRLVEPCGNTTMSSRIVRHQRNSFSGSASQYNTFDGVGKKSSSRQFSGSIQIVNGHPVDQRYARNCSFMEATSDGCTIDGLACVLKTIDGKRVWTLDGVTGAPQPDAGSASSSSAAKPRVTARMLNSVLEHIRNLDEFDEGSSEDEDGSSSSSSSSETSDDDESSSFSEESSSSSSSEKKRKHRKSSKKSSKKKKTKKR
jgi:hypothetical protein